MTYCSKSRHLPGEPGPQILWYALKIKAERREYLPVVFLPLPDIIRIFLLLQFTLCYLGWCASFASSDESPLKRVRLRIDRTGLEDLPLCRL